MAQVDRITVRIQWSEGLSHHECCFTMNAPDPGDALVEAILKRKNSLSHASVNEAHPDQLDLLLFP